MKLILVSCEQPLSVLLVWIWFQNLIITITWHISVYDGLQEVSRCHQVLSIHFNARKLIKPRLSPGLRMTLVRFSKNNIQS